MSPHPRRHWDLIAVNLALLLVASLFAGGAYGLYRNCLARHPAWQSTKSLLGKRVMGAMGFVNEPQTLAKNRLNLGAWFGFNEVVYAKTLRLAEIGCTVRFESDGYICILYDVRSDGFSGIRLSNRPDLPSTFFRSSPDGNFLSQAALSLPGPVAPLTPHAVRIRFEPGMATVFLDGRSAGSFPRTDGPQKIGFRGGQRASAVDHVSLLLEDGTTIQESFVDLGHVWKGGVAFLFAAGLGVGAAGLIANRQFRQPARRVGLASAIAAGNLVVLAFAAYAYCYVVPRSYPDVVSGIKRIAEWQMMADRQDLLVELKKEYSGVAPAKAYRILFLGSSQTWGAGAMRSEDVWVRQVERRLNAEGGGRTVQCINAGVPGFQASQVQALLAELRPLNPQAVVINLSSNDLDPAAFGLSLDAMVADLTRAGIRTVLLMEPNSPERRATDSIHGELASKHAVVANVGKNRAVPVIDVHRFLAEKNQTGFLWWDFVHLSSQGQHLVAEKLVAELPRLLQLR